MSFSANSDIVLTTSKSKAFYALVPVSYLCQHLMRGTETRFPLFDLLHPAPKLYVPSGFHVSILRIIKRLDQEASKLSTISFWKLEHFLLHSFSVLHHGEFLFFGDRKIPRSLQARLYALGRCPFNDKSSAEAR